MNIWNVQTLCPLIGKEIRKKNITNDFFKLKKIEVWGNHLKLYFETFEYVITDLSEIEIKEYINV